MQREIDINATPDFRWPTFVTTMFDLENLDGDLVQAQEAWKKATMKRIDLAGHLREAKATLKAVVNGVRAGIKDGDLTGKTKDERADERERIVDGNENVIKARRDVALLEGALEEAEAEIEDAIQKENILDRRIRWRQQILGTLATFTGRIPHAQPDQEKDPYVVGHDEVGGAPDVPQEADPGLWPTTEPVVMPEDETGVPF